MKQKWLVAYLDQELTDEQLLEKYNIKQATLNKWKAKWKKIEKGEKVDGYTLDDATTISLLEEYKITLPLLLFAENYIECGELYKSAKNAGFSEHQAKYQSYRFLKKEGVQRYIKDRLDVLAHRRIATQEEVLSMISKIAMREEKEVQVIKIKETEEDFVEVDGKMKKITKETEVPQLVEYPAKLTDVLKAAQTLLKRYEAGNGSDRVEIKIVDGWDDDE